MITSLMSSDTHFMIFTENVNNQQAAIGAGGSTRTRLLNNDNINNVEDDANNNNLTLDDLATLLRGSADILQNNAPRLSNIVNQASQQG